MPVEKTFHICWVVRVGLRLRASILIVKDASVLSRMIALGVLWRVSSPYSTQCLIFYEKSVVRKYFLSTDGWLLHDRMCSLYLTVLFFFFWSQLFVYKVHFCEEFNFSSPVDANEFVLGGRRAPSSNEIHFYSCWIVGILKRVTGKDSKCVRCIRSDEGLTLETSGLKLFTVANLPYQLSS